MENINLASAIQFLLPTAEFSYTNEDYSTIVWDVLDGEPPTIEEIEKAKIQLQKEKELLEKAKAQAKADLLERLGITADEAKLLLS